MYETIVVPLDGSKVGEAALPYVQELVSVLCTVKKVEVILLRVIADLTRYVVSVEEAVAVPYTEEELKSIKDSAIDYLNKIGEDLKKSGASVRAVVTTGDAAQEIIRVAEEVKAGLIAMSTHGRTGVSRVVLGSVTDKVVRQANIPTLVVRDIKHHAGS